MGEFDSESPVRYFEREGMSMSISLSLSRIRITTACAGVLCVAGILALLLPAEAAAQAHRQKITVRYENVSFEYDAALSKDYLAETAPAVPLEQKDDKPDGVAPRHTVISLRGSYAARLRRDASSAFVVPRIYVYPLSDPNDPKFNEEFPTTRQAAVDLARLLARRAGAFTDEIPFLPWFDEDELFIGRTKFIRFGNGRGFMFLTQCGQESSAVNNAELLYVFQGMTDDNAWYVSAVFPVAAQGFPATGKIDNEAEFSARYAGYIRQTTDRLNRLPARGFTPDLHLLESLVRSLRVNSH